MKTLYSRVKGTARSSQLKPLMVPETSHRRCYRATSPHAAPTDKTLSRLRTADTTCERCRELPLTLLALAGLHHPRSAHLVRRRAPSATHVVASSPAP